MMMMMIIKDLAELFQCYYVVEKKNAYPVLYRRDNVVSCLR